jgi:hypothetical protein
VGERATWQQLQQEYLELQAAWQAVHQEVAALVHQRPPPPAGATPTAGAAAPADHAHAPAEQALHAEHLRARIKAVAAWALDLQQRMALAAQAGE